MKIGDYVRTNKGIAKIIGKNDDVRYHYPNAWETDTYLEINDDTEYVYDENIIKSSSNIIDLIEEGDFVNGSKVIDIAQAPKRAIYIEDIQQHLALIPITNINRVVTKEHFESMEYKVGE